MPNQSSNLTEEEMAVYSTHSRRVDQKLVELWRLLYEHQVEQEGVHELMQELRSVIDEYPDSNT